MRWWASACVLDTLHLDSADCRNGLRTDRPHSATLLKSPPFFYDHHHRGGDKISSLLAMPMLLRDAMNTCEDTTLDWWPICESDDAKRSKGVVLVGRCSIQRIASKHGEGSFRCISSSVLSVHCYQLAPGVGNHSSNGPRNNGRSDLPMNPSKLFLSVISLLMMCPRRNEAQLLLADSANRGETCDSHVVSGDECLVTACPAPFSYPLAMNLSTHSLHR